MSSEYAIVDTSIEKEEEQFMHGIFVIDKPKLNICQQTLNALKGLFKNKRIGHLGTLDPFATGVLPVFVGEMTKLIPYCEDSYKTYEAELKLGEATDTLDCLGELKETKPVPKISESQIKELLLNLMGKRLQKAPVFSAIKIAGRPLYAMARKNKAKGQSLDVLETPLREVEIKRLELIKYEAPYLTFMCEVSRGTYVRSLGLEIAEALGTLGHLNNLRRTQSGFFSIAQAHKPSDLLGLNEHELQQKEIPLKYLFSKYQHVDLSEDLLDRMFKGQWLGPKFLDQDFFKDKPEGSTVFAYLNNQLRMLAEIKVQYEKLYLTPVRGIKCD